MPDQFERITDYAQRACSLDDAAQIRAIGARRLRRRKTGQAVLGTGAVALVGLGTTVAFNGTSHPRPGASTTTATTGTLTGPSPINPALSPSAVFCAGVGHDVTVIKAPLAPGTDVVITDPEPDHFFANYPDLKNHCDGDTYTFGRSEQEVLQTLHLLGFSTVTTTTASSQSVLVGDVADIRMQSGLSVIDRNITPRTPLVIVVSSGPAT